MRAIAAAFLAAGLFVESGVREAPPVRCDDADGFEEAGCHHQTPPPTNTSNTRANNAIRCGGMFIAAILAAIRQRMGHRRATAKMAGLCPSA